MDNSGLEAVNGKTVVKVGMAHLHPSCKQVPNISPRRCLNPLKFLAFDSETADKPVSDMLHFEENCIATAGSNSKISSERS